MLPSTLFIAVLLLMFTQELLFQSFHSFNNICLNIYHLSVKEMKSILFRKFVATKFSSFH